eukprot:TRINITY_DN12669_c0_g1_i1.p1 TRINITY_DN12669_c0_g1~~TRINITY_DN12669_c0_g1_i1.p1  ORF type:complete len:140 (+),score=36.42 TRINITY_DN12669_c0_g1_i1:81-500(+)
MAQEVPGSGGKVKKQIVKEGSGKMPAQGETVFAQYTGKLADGTVFDSTHTKPHRKEIGFYFTLGAGEVIQGWDVGFASMKVGEEAVLTIAPEFGYGAQGSPGLIPPNATLTFEVKLTDARVLSPQERAEIDAKVAALRR